MNNVNKIAIIGAGYSGTMVAVHLLRQAVCPLAVYLIEPSPQQFCRGVAYSADQDCHLLNVPAFNMSAFPDDPGHFYTWAKARENDLLNPPWLAEISPASFLPRRVYGDYLVDLLDKTVSSTPDYVRLERKIDKAIAVTISDGQVNVHLLGGGMLHVQKAVLAIGNFPPSDPWISNPAFYQSGRYFSNPWLPGLLPKLLNTDSCLLVGSGLTMVDWAVALKVAGYQGIINTISRRGLRPQTHRLPNATPAPMPVEAIPTTVRQWLQQLRRLNQEVGHDWRTVIDGLRPVSQSVWAGLPLIEQQRFLRHLRSYWDCHRHRLAPVIGETLEELLGSWQLRPHVGRIIAYQPNSTGVDVSIRLRGKSEQQTLNVNAVVNCSGSESDYRKLACPLVKNLLAQGLASPDDLRLGLNVSENSALIDGDKLASNYLFTIGPPQKGHYWETTAVPEIRGQAAKLAGYLLAQIEKSGSG
ncbi:MAG: FAD/NAD(P)-binding protein [Methylovulum sp.]|uniref:FAD/NAD(P)-binding protein n=1 Tax=Methylovulum sp. TaxID=1916980 RepID=UPI00260AB563|nr:FAD/NAD(P)-binding protein [Methylovulum sp.]MDD2723369.1 FAD/NAD(P)-binding protein [Methylovulum sp.]MDD5124264.1 FAD/NAD(P)-binding protein [Methylovulum sp.]